MQFLGLVNTAQDGNDHQLQLWLESNGTGFQWIVRSAYMHNSKLVRSCVLDNGSGDTRDDALAGGRAAFARLKAA